MSYRFLLDDKGWRVFASIAVIQAPTFSDVRLGVIGVDFNVGFVAVSETDRFGNIVASQDVSMITAGLAKHATQTAISAAQLSYASPGRQRMLSSFAYTRFAQTVGARAHDAGIEVVGAAYSSRIGAQKYARRYGLSGHRAAAFVLARHGQQLPDRLKPSRRKRFATERAQARAAGRSFAQGRAARTSSERCGGLARREAASAAAQIAAASLVAAARIEAASGQAEIATQLERIESRLKQKWPEPIVTGPVRDLIVFAIAVLTCVAVAVICGVSRRSRLPSLLPLCSGCAARSRTFGLRQ